MSVRRRILGPPVIKMPTGLVEIMDGLARDVLKNNPENIYEFCARHMHTLLEIRDGRALKPFVTLEQKIEKAQKIVKQRAEQRWQAHDNKIKDETNGQQVLCAESRSSVNDSEYSGKKEMQKAFIDVESEEKAKEEQLFLENSAVLCSELVGEPNDKKDTLNEVSVDAMEETKGDEKKSGQEESSIVTDSDKNEKKSLLTEHDDLKTDVIIEGRGIDYGTKNDSSTEIQSLVSLNIDKADNDNVMESLPDNAPIKLESNDNNDGNIILPEDSVVDIHLHTEVPIIHNDGGIEPENEVEVEADMKDINDEINSRDTIVLPSDDNSETNEKQLEVLSPSKSLNDDRMEDTSNTEANENVIKTQFEVLGQSKASQDDEILTVILGTNSIVSSSLQNSEQQDIVHTEEIEPVQITGSESFPNDLKQTPDQTIDIESVPATVNDNDKTHNMNSSMDLETAAITIQKVFRSFLFKTKTASYDDSTTVDLTMLTEDKEKEDEVLNVKDRRQMGISRMDTVLQTVNEEKSLSLSTDDSSTLSSAATIIQAHVRGFLVRNKLNLNKTISSNSIIDSDAPSMPSLEADNENIRSKTVLNIHIVPESDHFVSRDESILTSMDLSLDSSPPSSVNLHPLGYDKSERRKQLKREDAVQSVSPPSNNSGKLSEDHDSVKEVLTVESNAATEQVKLNKKTVETQDVAEKGENKVVTENDYVIKDTTSNTAQNDSLIENQTSGIAENDSLIKNPTSDTAENDSLIKNPTSDTAENDSHINNPISDAASDELDVITPFIEDRSPRESDNSTKLLHSGEFHDIVVPTNVTRSDTSVVRDFQNVLVYFIVWNN